MKEIIGYDKKYLVTGYDIENMILLTNIEYLCTEQKGCWKSDESFGKMILVGRQGTNNRIKKLSNDGWIEISTINIRGGKKRTLIWLNKEILQSSPSDIVKESTILPRLYCQYNDGTIDNITGSDNSIDISLDINLEVSDGANKQESIRKYPESDHRNEVKEDSGQILLVREKLKKKTMKKKNELKVIPTKTLHSVSSPFLLEEGQIEEPQQSPYHADIETLEETLNDYFEEELPNWKILLKNYGHRVFLQKLTYEFKLNEFLQDVIVAYSKKTRVEKFVKASNQKDLKPQILFHSENNI